MNDVSANHGNNLQKLDLNKDIVFKFAPQISGKEIILKRHKIDLPRYWWHTVFQIMCIVHTLCAVARRTKPN